MYTVPHLEGLNTLTIFVNIIFNDHHPYFQGTPKRKEFGTLRIILLHWKAEEKLYLLPTKTQGNIE